MVHRLGPSFFGLLSPGKGQWSLTRVRGLYGQLVQIRMLTNSHWRATASVWACLQLFLSSDSSLLYSFVFKHPVGNLLLLSYFCGSDGKESACNSRDLGLILRSERSPGERNGCSLQYFFSLRIPWTEEPGGLQSMGLQRVGCDWVTNTCTFQATSTRQEVGLSGSISTFWNLCLMLKHFGKWEIASQDCLSFQGLNRQ